MLLVEVKSGVGFNGGLLAFKKVEPILDALLIVNWELGLTV